MAANDIRGVAFDGSTGAIRWGARPIGLTKIDFPKESVKKEKIRLIGDQVARYRTMGAYDADDFTCEMLTSIFSASVLPNLPQNGGNLFEFVITAQEKHPLVRGAYTVVMDRCCIVGYEDGIENSEKASITKVTISVIEVFRKGANGRFTSLAWNPRGATPAASEFLF